MSISKVSSQPSGSSDTKPKEQLPKSDTICKAAAAFGAVIGAIIGGPIAPISAGVTAWTFHSICLDKIG